MFKRRYLSVISDLDTVRDNYIPVLLFEFLEILVAPNANRVFLSAHQSRE